MFLMDIMVLSWFLPMVLGSAIPQSNSLRSFSSLSALPLAPPLATCVRWAKASWIGCPSLGRVNQRKNPVSVDGEPVTKRPDR